ncbi:MAG: hypothetical protein JRJ51_23835 [Deltaproteobacteria bacterium]|nr:hypothetical protein [Deltaproteobacteria bacterium]
MLAKWLDLYEDEIALFLWSALILFLIRTSNILFNNFAETAFLKRFGVQYLPYITAVNSVSTFFIMGLLTGIMVKASWSRRLEAGCCPTRSCFAEPLWQHFDWSSPWK